jgi:hypothetical protein
MTAKETNISRALEICEMVEEPEHCKEWLIHEEILYEYELYKLKSHPKYDLYCENISSPACLMFVARESANEQICKRIVESGYRNICFMDVARIKKDETVCNYIPKGDYRNFCITRVGQAKDDVTVCNLIENETQRERCIINVEDICDLPKEQCELDPDCFWKFLGGIREPVYTCCPKDIDKWPDRCFIVIE